MLTEDGKHLYISNDEYHRVIERLEASPDQNARDLARYMRLFAGRA